MVGLTVGVIFAVSGLTGSALAFREELDLLLHGELLRVEPVRERVPLDAVVEAAASLDSGRSAWIRLPERSTGTFMVVTADPDPLEIYVHPGTGEVLGSRRTSGTLPNQLFALHHALLGGETGERVLGVTALLTLVLLATGLFVWWPGMRRGWRGLRRALLVRRTSNLRSLAFDLHRAGGFWVAVFLAMSAFTGASLIFHDAFMTGLDRVTGSPPRPAPVVLPARGQGDAMPVERLVREHGDLVEGRVTYVTLPWSESAPLIIRKKTPEEWHPSGRNFIQVDPARGEVVALETDADAPLGTRLYNVLYPLHVGAWGALPGRVLLAFMGLTPAALLVTGVLLWWWRSRPRSAHGSRRSAARTMAP